MLTPRDELATLPVNGVAYLLISVIIIYLKLSKDSGVI